MISEMYHMCEGPVEDHGYDENKIWEVYEHQWSVTTWCTWYIYTVYTSAYTEKAIVGHTYMWTLSTTHKTNKKCHVKGSCCVAASAKTKMNIY